jgi:DNA-binding transcriptional ArsR family regulator
MLLKKLVVSQSCLMYNTFNIMNVSSDKPNSPQLSEVFALLGQPARLQIILAIGTEKVCVCQLEKLMGNRQAYISQQLMLLREAGLVETERVGRHIFYYVPDKRWLELIEQAAAIQSIELPKIELPAIEECEYKP